MRQREGDNFLPLLLSWCAFDPVLSKLVRIPIFEENVVEEGRREHHLYFCICDVDTLHVSLLLKFPDVCCNEDSAKHKLRALNKDSGELNAKLNHCLLPFYLI